MTRLDRKSDSQANAEALARRDLEFLSEHYGSRGQRDGRGRPSPRPRGLIAMLAWFETEWHSQAPEALHKREVWREYIAANEHYARVGGGSALGTHAWTEPARRLLESPTSLDRDEQYVLPLAAALRKVERRDAFMATFLRAVALAGFQVSPVGMRLGYHESVCLVYAETALERLWHAYRIEPPPRLLTDDGYSGVSSAQSKPAVATGIVSATPASDGSMIVASPSPRDTVFPPDPPTLTRVASE